MVGARMQCFLALALACIAPGALALVPPTPALHRTPAFHRRASPLFMLDLATSLLGADEGRLAELVADNFDALDAPTMEKLQGGDADAANRVFGAINAETERRMAAAKDKLEEILDAGELLEMDRRLMSLFKRGGADVPFLMCLNANANAADEGSDKRMVLEHLYTRAQEELEKKADPAKAVLHKLNRTPDKAIRDNVLHHYLAPQTELITPDATVIPLDKPIPPRVTPEAFAGAIDDTVAQLRGLDADGDLIRANIEQCRQIAIEARGILVNTGTPEQVAYFEEELSKTWPLGSTD